MDTKRLVAALFLSFLMVFSPLSPAARSVIAEDETATESGTPTEASTETDTALDNPFTGTEMNTRVSVARSALDYPVTPGDVYRLAFQRSTQSVEAFVTVDSEYRVNLGVLGRIDGEGKTFRALAAEVRRVVETAYPSSFPQFDIETVATFEVMVTGEVGEAGLRTVRGPARLDRTIRPELTIFSSIRDVQLERLTGDRFRVDLFAARRDGRLDQNPYLQPGDTITVTKAERRVTLSGAVVRSGTYQLLPGEDLDTLISRYGAGFSERANPEDVRITSYDVIGGQELKTEYLSFPADDIPPVTLYNADVVTIGTKTENLPVMFFEGAVGGARGADGTSASGAVADQVLYQFLPGETLRQATQSLRGRFLTTADLANAFLLRQGEDESIPVNLAEMLFAEDVEGEEIYLQRNDRVIVPFRQYFVTVSGAVNSPGQYPYIPNRGYRYYLGLAGGTDPQRHIGENPRIRSVDGERKRDGAIIEPEDDIFFASTNPIYHLSPILGVASTILSSIALVMSLTN